MSSQPQTDFNGPIAGEPAKEKAKTSQRFAASHDGNRGHEVHAWSHGQTTGEWLIW